MVQSVDTVVLETMGEIRKSSSLFIPTINRNFDISKGIRNSIFWDDKSAHCQKTKGF